MLPSIGVLFALGAMVSWAFGDFSIQRATRAVGSVRALFYIVVLGALALLPFVWREIVPAFQDTTDFPLLAVAGFVLSLTALASFEGLKKGKLSVVLPINGIELIVVLGLAITLSHERYAAEVYGLMFCTVMGLILTTVVSVKNLKNMVLEKGVFWAILGAVGLGLSNYTIGLASRASSPLLTIWFTNIVMVAMCSAIMLKRGDFAQIKNDFKRHSTIIATQSALDNAAWICYAYAAVSIPIGIATTVSEGYLALGTIIGVAVNKERLKKHQYVGVAATIVSVMALGWLTGG